MKSVGDEFGIFSPIDEPTKIFEKCFTLQEIEEEIRLLLTVEGFLYQWDAISKRHRRSSLELWKDPRFRFLNSPVYTSHSLRDQI